MTKRRNPKRYSDNDRALALAALAANAGNITRTAKDLGIPAGTIRGWAKGLCHPDVADLRDQKKPALADALEAVVRGMVAALPAKIEAAPFQQVATSIGILIDKMRLLRNEPTEIARTEGAANDPLTARIDSLAAAFARAADREEAGAVPTDGAGEPVGSP